MKIKNQKTITKIRKAFDNVYYLALTGNLSGFKARKTYRQGDKTYRQGKKDIIILCDFLTEIGIYKNPNK